MLHALLPPDLVLDLGVVRDGAGIDKTPSDVVMSGVPATVMSKLLAGDNPGSGLLATDIAGLLEASGANKFLLVPTGIEEEGDGPGRDIGLGDVTLVGSEKSNLQAVLLIFNILVLVLHSYLNIYLCLSCS